jgi:U3 small nucleolar RNA-associated protein 14
MIPKNKSTKPVKIKKQGQKRKRNGEVYKDELPFSSDSELDSNSSSDSSSGSSSDSRSSSSSDSGSDSVPDSKPSLVLSNSRTMSKTKAKKSNNDNNNGAVTFKVTSKRVDADSKPKSKILATDPINTINLRALVHKLTEFSAQFEQKMNKLELLLKEGFKATADCSLQIEKLRADMNLPE